MNEENNMLVFRFGKIRISSMIKYMTNIESISFHDIPLNNISKSIGKLINLKKIYFDNCDFNMNNSDCVKKSKYIFKKLTNLERLSLASCDLFKLPKFICNLTNLKYLNLFENGLFDLPSSIYRLQKLEELDISLNHIGINSKLKSFKRLLNLKCLIVDNLYENNWKYLLQKFNMNNITLYIYIIDYQYENYKYI